MKFTKIYENTITRHINGGLLTGDLVQFKKNAIHYPAFEDQDELKFLIRALMASDLNLRVVNIKNSSPAVMGGSNTDYINKPTDRIVDIAQEIAPGRFYNFVSVPLVVLDVINTGINGSPIPDSLKRKDTTQIEPRLVDIKADGLNAATINQTMKSPDAKGKLVDGDRTLKNTNIKIPSKSAKDIKYTNNYLPKGR
jgi:hypothetical protein